MPTTKKFLDQDGLIQLLQEIESLDETNIKDVYWSTDNADTYPTIVFKVGDDNGSAHTIKKFTFKGDMTTPAPSNTTTRSITLTIGGTDKTITYYDTTGSAGVTYTNAADTGTPASATNVKTALDRVINKLASIITDLNTVATGKGADMVAYSSSNSVKDALDDIYDQIGGSGGGGNSLTDRVGALEDAVGDLDDNKADITEAVGSITGTANGNESGSYTMVDGTTTGTFLYKNNKVAQEEDTTSDGLIPILLGSGVVPNSVGEKVKYNTLIGYNPSSGVLNLKNKTTPSSFIQMNGDSISLYKQAGTGSVSISVDGGFTGKAASATNDGNNRNIVNTYATKQELNALSNKWTGQFQIASTLPTLSNTEDETANENANKQYLGYIYLIRDEEHGGVNNNVFNEYIVVSEIDESLDRIVWKWELLGTTDAGVDVVSIPATGANSVASLFDTYVTNA